MPLFHFFSGASADLGAWEAETVDHAFCRLSEDAGVLGITVSDAGELVYPTESARQLAGTLGDYYIVENPVVEARLKETSTAGEWAWTESQSTGSASVAEWLMDATIDLEEVDGVTVHDGDGGRVFQDVDNHETRFIIWGGEA
jgi:hypothetical protein